MTLQEALAELEVALDRRQVVNIDDITMRQLLMSVKGQTNRLKYHCFANPLTGEIRYVFKTGHAEELRDMVRHVIAEQVAGKLTQ